jgi:hypothetical protein
MSASLAMNLAGTASRSRPSASSAAIRVALIASGPVSCMSVRHLSERRALIVMLSVDRLSEIASKPILPPMATSHSRVRLAVLPERSIRAPNRSSASSASSAGGALRLASLSSVDATLRIGRGSVAGEHQQLERHQ